MRRTRILAVVVVVVPAWLIMPLENRIRSENVRLRYGAAAPLVTRELRDRIPQGMAIALLAGFRGVVADFLWIESHGYWEKKEWLRQYADMEVVSMLQPLSTLFWETGAWHMAWNIGYGVSVDPANRTQAEGIKREHEWWDKARDFLERGLKNVPNQPDLYFSMGWLYQEKYKDPCKAQEFFHRAVNVGGEMTSIAIRMDAVERLEARAMEKCGDVMGAYQYWKRLWFLDHSKTFQPWSVVEREIKRMENVLNIPDKQRVFPKEQSKPASTP
jgi:hypothetical protein